MFICLYVDNGGERSFVPSSNLKRETKMGTVRFGAVWYGLVQFGAVYYILIRFGTVKYILVSVRKGWYGYIIGIGLYFLVRFGTYWYGLIWFEIISVWFGTGLFSYIIGLG